MDAVKNNARGAALGFLAMTIYASHDAVVKLLGGRFSPFQIVFFAALLSFPVIAFIMLNERAPGSLRPRFPFWVILRALCTIVSGVCAFYAYSVLPLAQVYPIMFAAPLLVTVLSIPLLGETVRLRRWIAVVVGLIGVVIVVRPGQTELSPGHMAAMLAALCGALSSGIVRKVGAQERSIVLLLYPMMGNFIAMGIALPFVYVPMEIGDLGLMAVIALFGMLGAFVIILAYRAGEAVIVAPMQYSQILWAVLYGWLLFGDSVDGQTLLGSAVVIGSGIYIVWREGRSGASLNQPVLRTRQRLETAITPRVSLLSRMLKRQGALLSPDPAGPGSQH